MTLAEAPPFIAKSVDRLDISEIGYSAGDRMPFVKLKSGITFYGPPVQLTERPSGQLLNLNQYATRLTEGVVQLINNVRVRYYGEGRPGKQHARYIYKPGDVVLELGAYHGYYSLYIAERIGASGTLIPVEFVPDNYHILERNMQANFPDRATALNVGIDARPGKKKAFIGNEQVAGFQEAVVAHYQGENYQVLDVQTDTVDNIVRDHELDAIDLVIVQVNGHEIQAFQGMQKSLPKIRNMAIASPYNHTDILSKRLKEAGYQIEVENERWIYASRAGF